MSDKLYDYADYIKLRLVINLYCSRQRLSLIHISGKGELMLTGQLGDVMKESAQAGITYIRSIASDYKVEPEFFQENDIHVHIPEGAVPKDGPSAGCLLYTSCREQNTLPVTNHSSTS